MTHLRSTTALGVGAVLGATVLLATPALARTLMVGPGQPYSMPSAAAAAAQDGDSISIAAGNYKDCAAWSANNLTITGAGAATVIGSSTCQDKGVFVVYGSNITVRDLTLSHATSSSQNGAGLRAEGTNLAVERVHFLYNQDGVLADPVAKSTILVRDSFFVGNGYCGSSGQNCAHGIYIGAVASFTIEHSTFRNTQIGHHIKSRAAITNVIDNTIDDGPTGTSSYLIDVPNGSQLTISGNHMEKGPLSSNPSAAISIGEEGVTWAQQSIQVSDNVFRNDGAPTTFVVNTTPTQAELVGNTFQGNPVKALSGAGSVR